MKKETLAKIAIASAICAPACCVEKGVVVERQELSDEKALYVNLLDVKHEQARAANTFHFLPGTFVADRKLFFNDSTYVEPFIYAMPGDTIAFCNPFHATYIDMNKCNRVHDINGVSERNIIYQMKPLIKRYNDWLQNNR